MQPERDEVQEVDKLTENDALRGRILHPEVTELLNQCLDLRRRPPFVEVEAAEDALADFCGIFELQSRSFQVDGKSNVADRAGGLIEC